MFEPSLSDAAAAPDHVADFVIIGAGSAGCVLADRLSADGCHRVLLIEAGGDDRPTHNPGQFAANVNIHLPAGFAKLLGNPKVDWAYRTEPDPGSDSRRHAYTKGRVLGGSSSINGLLYVRGQPADYDGWRQNGCTGWAWDDVLPYFKKLEHHAGAFASTYGHDGPVPVERTRMMHPVTDAILQAWGEAGVPANDDYNGARQEGAGLLHLTTRAGRRQSAAVAYLHAAMRRPNLVVLTSTLAEKLLFDGDRACGVAYRHDGRPGVASATAEVILCGGSINSPQLLQLSGIGPGAVLRAAGIEVRRDVPEVGAHLQDHFNVASRYRLRPGTPSFNQMSRGWGLARQILRYARDRGGLLAAGGVHATAFVRSNPGLETPDLQFFMSPATIDYGALSAGGGISMERQPGFTIGGYQMRPHSTGSVMITSPDPQSHPAIQPNYLAEPADRAAVIDVLRWSRRVSSQPALSAYLESEMKPGAEQRDDDALLAYARANGTTAYHPVGTCRMSGQPDSVVDPHLLVRGTRGLRVVDASIMPRIVSGNTNAATLMIAERAADLIRGRDAA